MQVVQGRHWHFVKGGALPAAEDKARTCIADFPLLSHSSWTSALAALFQDKQQSWRNQKQIMWKALGGEDVTMVIKSSVFFFLMWYWKVVVSVLKWVSFLFFFFLWCLTVLSCFCFLRDVPKLHDSSGENLLDLCVHVGGLISGAHATVLFSEGQYKWMLEVIQICLF